MPYKMTPFHRRDCVLLLKNKLKIESGSRDVSFTFSLILKNCIETKQSFVYQPCSDVLLVLIRRTNLQMACTDRV